MNSKYIFITGGIVSPGDMSDFSSSLACLLKARGFRVAILNLAPYLNHDSSTLNSSLYGECYITADGCEMPPELGIYERFLEQETSQNNCVTLGNVFQTVCNKERRGDFNGEKVRFSVHVIDEIKHRITHFADSGKYDMVLVQLSDCITETDSLPFIEAIGQLRYEAANATCSIHISSLENDFTAIEPIRKLTMHGMYPDAVILLTDSKDAMNSVPKIARAGNIPEYSVSILPTETSSIKAPFVLHNNAVDLTVLRTLGLNASEPDLNPWFQLMDKKIEADENVPINIAVIGCDSSLKNIFSLVESLKYAALRKERTVNVHAIEIGKINSNSAGSLLDGIDGIVIPGQINEIGEESCIEALKWSRENDVPTLAIGFGMACMVKEYARNVMKQSDKDLIELSPTRIGAEPCSLQQSSLAASAYNQAETVIERHHHSFEINKNYTQRLEQAGMCCSGTTLRTGHVDVVEVPGQRWFIGTIFNPEYTSTIQAPNPLIADFVCHTINYHNQKNQNG